MKKNKYFEKIVASMKKLGKFTIKDIQVEIPQLGNQRIWYVINQFSKRGEVERIGMKEYQMINHSENKPEIVTSSFVPVIGSLEAIILEKILGFKKQEFGSFEVARMISKKYSKKQISMSLISLCKNGKITRLRRGSYSLAEVPTNSSSDGLFNKIKGLINKALDEKKSELDEYINNLTKIEAEKITEIIEQIAEKKAQERVVPYSIEAIKKFMDTSQEDVKKMFEANALKS